MHVAAFGHGRAFYTFTASRLASTRSLELNSTLVAGGPERLDLVTAGRSDGGRTTPTGEW